MIIETCFNLGDILEISMPPTSGAKSGDPITPMLGRIDDIVVHYASTADYDVYYRVSINNGDRFELAADPEFCNIDRQCDQKEVERLGPIYKVIRHYIPYDSEYPHSNFRADMGMITADIVKPSISGQCGMSGLKKS